MFQKISRTIVLVGLVATVGCSSTPQLKTQSYALVYPETESLLISGIADDEFNRFDVKQQMAVVNAHGGSLALYKKTSEDTVIVRTTTRGHAAIQKTLKQSRQDIAANHPGT